MSQSERIIAPEIPKVFLSPKRFGDLTSHVTKDQTDKLMNSLGLGEIADTALFKVESVNISGGRGERTVEVPVYQVDGFNVWDLKIKFSRVKRRSTDTSRTFVVSSDKAVIKSGHTHKEKTEVLKECAKTRDRVEAGYPVVPQVAVIADSQTGDYFVIEPRGVTLGGKIDSAAKAYCSHGDMSGIDEVISVISQFLRKLRDMNLSYVGSGLRRADALILFSTPDGLKTYATDDKTFLRGFKTIWTDSIVDDIAEKAVPLPEIDDIKQEMAPHMPTASARDIEIASKREYSRQYTEHGPKRREFKKTLLEKIKAETGVDIGEQNP